MDTGTEQAESPRRLLSVAGAAKVLGISAPGVKRLIRSGALPTIEVGDAVRIPLAAVDRLVQTGANQEEPGGVQEVVEGLAALDELRAGQAELLEEVRGLRDEIAGLLKRQEEKPRPEALLTVKEVAELLRVSRHTVYGWADRGDGPPFNRIGRSLRFRRQDVLDWLEADRQEPPHWRVELESRRRAEAGLRRKEVDLQGERRMADAPGLLDPIALAGWSSTCRLGRWMDGASPDEAPAGPGWEAWCATALTMSEPGSARSGKSRGSGPIVASGGSTATARSNGLRHGQGVENLIANRTLQEPTFAQPLPK